MNWSAAFAYPYSRPNIHGGRISVAYSTVGSLLLAEIINTYYLLSTILSFNYFICSIIHLLYVSIQLFYLLCINYFSSFTVMKMIWYRGPFGYIAFGRARSDAM